MNVFDTTFKDWSAVQDPKVKGTWNLHNALSQVDLDFFVLFSSVSATLGRPGQSSYSSANTFLDSFAQFRQSLGRRCSVINIGAVEGIGSVHKLGQEAIFKTMNRVLVQESDLLDTIELSILQSQTPTLETPHKQLGSSWSKSFRFANQVAVGLELGKVSDDSTHRLPENQEIRTGLAIQLSE